MSEIVKLRDGSYVMLDLDRCEWLFGLVKGDRVWINLKGDNPALEGEILEIIWDVNEKEYILKLSYFDTSSTVLVRAKDVEHMVVDK